MTSAQAPVPRLAVVADKTLDDDTRSLDDRGQVNSAWRLPLATVQQHLIDYFDLDVTGLSALGGETDQNLRVETRDAGTWFARLTAAPREEVDWQDALLTHVERFSPELPLPRLRPAVAGSTVVALTGGDGSPVLLRVMSWLPGQTLSEVAYHPASLLRELGATAGRLSRALAAMPAPDREWSHAWDMRVAHHVVTEARWAIDDSDNLHNVDVAMSWFDGIAPLLGRLPQAVVHHDLNDANVLVDHDADGSPHISGIVDVGDALHSARVTELAIAVAYAMVRKEDPLAAAAEVVAGFCEVLPLADEELAVVYPLALARLCMNACTWNQRVRETGSVYGQERMHDTWPTLARLVEVHPALAEEHLRLACDRPVADRHAAAAELIAALAFDGVGEHPGGWPTSRQIDLTPASDLFDERDWTSSRDVAAALHDARGGDSSITLVIPHLQASLLRAGRRQPGLKQPATIQLGTAVLTQPGTSVSSPVPAVVEAIGGDERVVLRHQQPATGAPLDDRALRTVWHGLRQVRPVGTVLAPREVFAVVGDVTADGTAAGERLLGPGFQVQVVAEADLAAQVPRFVRPNQREVWQRVSPDPAPLLGMAPAEQRLMVGDVVRLRRRHLASSQRNYYSAPMSLARGRDVWFYDEDALSYLDSLNNVTHVGHAEPRVTAAAARQMRKLNTNSRFVYPQITEFAAKLTATLPDPLEVVFLVCSGSEANDLALRIARQVTGRLDVVNIDGAYHGNTGWVTGISPNRYKGAGGLGAPPTTHEVPIPDRYRGRYGYDDDDAGAHYAHAAKLVIDEIVAADRSPAAFIAESLMGSAGNIVHPPGYLSGVFAAARAAGALCISDEVQVGVGRLGPWWGFELQGVVPDIVTMGKPLGNGHPLAALVTTREIADAFDTGMKYFNTFGGNPVSCAIGSTVLDIVERDGLRGRAVEVGGYFADQLRRLATRQPLVGDVRAEGLYLGVELVVDRDTKQPARQEALAVTEIAKERGVVVFPNGASDNVLKIKPPMTFDSTHVDLYVEVLDQTLTDVAASHHH